MNGSLDAASLKRNGLVAGIAAAVLFVAGYLIGAVLPGGGTTDPKDITDFYAGNGPNAALLLSIVLAFGGMCVIWFLTSLAARLNDGIGTRVGYALGLIGVALLVAGAFIMAGPSGATVFSDSDPVDVPTAIAFAQSGLGVMLAGGMFTLAVATIVLSLAARGSDDYPTWLVWVGVVVGVLMFGSIIWLPGLLFAVWLLCVSVAGFRPIE